MHDFIYLIFQSQDFLYKIILLLCEVKEVIRINLFLILFKSFEEIIGTYIFAYTYMFWS